MRLTDSSFEYEEEEYKYITVFDDDEDESDEYKTKYVRMIKVSDFTVRCNSTLPFGHMRSL